MAIPDGVLDLLVAECLVHPEAYAELGWLCDNVGGRTSGAESGNRAEEWAKRYFAKWGLENVRFEDVPVTAWTRGSIDVRATGPVPWQMIALAHGNAPCNADVSAPIIDVGHGDRSDYEPAKDEVKGKLALCDEGCAEGKRALHRSEKLTLAIEYGAAGLMILSSATGGLPRTGICHHTESPIPSLGISNEDGERLKRLLKQGVVTTVSVRMSNSIGPATAHNVIADLRGTEKPGEVVLAGGHLDSWDVAQGATDNGLGSAIVLEMARALAKAPRPRRTLRFALWAAEETGLYGSTTYTKVHTDELDDIAAVMNFDMTGDPFGYWTAGRKEPSALLREMAKKLAGLGMREEFAYKAGLHSDHQPFMLEGVPIVALMARLEGQGGHYYHAVGDTFEKVSQPGLCRAAAVGAATMWALANAPDRTYARFTSAEVDAMVDEADLRDALSMAGWWKK